MATATLQTILQYRHPRRLVVPTTTATPPPAGGRFSFKHATASSSKVVVSALPSSSSSSISYSTAMAASIAASINNLDRLLAAGDFRGADEATRAHLIEIAGEPAQRRGYVFFSEVRFFSIADLRAIDDLWRRHSGGRFGYAVQRRILDRCGGDFTKFFIRVGWMKRLAPTDDAPGQFIYRAYPDEFMWELADDTPEGHLPLTNALRGTQLLKSILTHPAFEDEASPAAAEEKLGQENPNSGKAKPIKDFKSPDYSF